jgi:hypothetical protein
VELMVTWCDWCCLEENSLPIRRLERFPASGRPEGSAWRLELCPLCCAALDGKDFAGFCSRRELHAGVQVVERRSP